MKTIDDFPNHAPITFGSSLWRITKANARLTDFESEIRVMPDDTDPAALEALADRAESLAAYARKAADYSRHIRQIAAEADASVAAMFGEKEPA